MKKLLSILMAVCLCASFTLFFTSCDEHDHEYAETWEFDSTSHWHKCSVGSCSKVSDKGEHTWGERTDGEKETVCTTCLAIKGWPASKEEWTASTAKENFTNVTVTYTVKGEGDEDAKTYTVKLTADAFEKRESTGTEATEYYFFENATTKKEEFLNSFLLSVYKDSFVFDAQNACYVTYDMLYSGMLFVGSSIMDSSNVQAEDGDIITMIEISKATVRFDSEGRLVFFAGTLTQTEAEVQKISETTQIMKTLSETKSEFSYTFSDYGTTVIPVAEG